MPKTKRPPLGQIMLDGVRCTLVSEVHPIHLRARENRRRHEAWIRRSLTKPYAKKKGVKGWHMSTTLT